MVEPEAVHAVEANFVESWWGLVEAADGELHREAEARWFAAGDHAILNSVIETRTRPLPDGGAIERIASDVERSAGSCVWWVLPSAAETSLAHRLAAAGFEPWGDPWPGMALALDRLAPVPEISGLVLERVQDREAFEEYLAVFDATLSPGPAFTDAFHRAAVAVGFDGDAPMAHFVVREEGVAVSCASLIVSGGAAGLYNVGTLERVRGRGIGAWVSNAALEEGRERGLATGVLQASKLGYRVYERLGFREVCQLTPWIRTQANDGVGRRRED